MRKNQFFTAVLTVFIAIGGWVAPAAAQDLSRSQVPSVVVNAFKKEFPKAVNIDWELKQGLYEAEFEIGRMDHEAWLDKEGRIVRYKQEIKPRSLPDALRNNVRSQHKGFRIMEAEKMVQGNSTVYKLELRSLSRELDVYVDQQGNLVDGVLW